MYGGVVARSPRPTWIQRTKAEFIIDFIAYPLKVMIFNTNCMVFVPDMGDVPLEYVETERRHGIGTETQKDYGGPRRPPGFDELTLIEQRVRIKSEG
ncbi:hypothetical protein EVAR_66836_1 [Eumeta japonica]|uniref:Uncharacterized protein n=1 Tax=Eumeta variegata TaxID=151549 RepID=A0A4C1Z9H5_EUMVA|nr:hypothetical protein EVAR_66836_1 [Eumeta japonica]